MEKREGLLISTLGADEGFPFAMAHQQVRTSLGELYSTYFNDLFVLKTGVTISGQPAEMFYTSDLVLKCGCFSLNEASAELGALLRNYGVCQVNNIWCDEAPLIQVRQFCLPQPRLSGK